MARPPQAGVWERQYLKRLKALNAAWADHVESVGRRMLDGRVDGRRADEFDPSQPRDEIGRWTAGAGGGVGHSAQHYANANFSRSRAETYRATGFHIGHEDIHETFGAHVGAEHVIAALGDHHALPPGKITIRMADKSSTGKILPKGAIEVEYKSSGDEEHDYVIRRQFWREGNSLVAHHDLFTLPKEAQGKGIGKAVLEAQAKQERALGVTQITLDAAWAGKAVWPKLGFKKSGKGTGKTIPMHATPNEVLEAIHGRRDGIGDRDGTTFRSGLGGRPGVVFRAERVRRGEDGAALGGHTSVTRVPVRGDNRRPAGINPVRSGLVPRADGPVDDLRAAYLDLVKASGLEQFLGRFAGQISDANKTYVQRVTKLPPGGVARQQVIEEFRRANVRLITNLAQHQAEDIAGVLREAQAAGARWEETVPAIKERLGVSLSRAKLIARDQTNKFNGAMQQAHQTASGITEYRWKTAGDMAVRGRPGGEYAKSKEDHWALEGTRQRWDAPPLIPGTNVHAHPGKQIQCRCQAIPIVEFFEE